MAHFYLSFKTMQAITQAPQRANEDALLWIIAGASELSCERTCRTLSCNAALNFAALCVS